MSALCGYITQENRSDELLYRMIHTLEYRGLQSKHGKCFSMGKYRIALAKCGDCTENIIISQRLESVGELNSKTLNEIEFEDSFLYYNEKQRKVFLCRDRMGETPLFIYYAKNGDVFFSSDIQSFFECDDFDKTIDKSKIPTYLHHSYVQEPDTVYLHVKKVRKGNFISIKIGDNLEVKEVPYWTIPEVYNNARKNQANDYENAKKQVKLLLQESVRKRMDGKNAVGAFLSGGYDSSAIVAIMQEMSEEPINTYCMGFEKDSLNESAYAKKVADNIGTNHKTFRMSESDFIQYLNIMNDSFAEPLADPATIPTLFMSEQVVKEVPNILTGVGGDELFVGGLSIYALLTDARKKAIPGHILYMLKHVFGINTDDLPLKWRVVAEDWNKKAQTQQGVNYYFNYLNSILLEPVENSEYYFEVENLFQEENWGVRRSLLDIYSYSVESELVKEDRATTRYGLNRQCPIYDKNLMEYVFSLPAEYKQEAMIGKRILRDVVYDYIPRNLLDRPKSGFCIPQVELLLGPLKEELTDLCNVKYIKKQSIFNAEGINRLLQNFYENGAQYSGKSRNLISMIWPLFIYQKWYDKWILHNN